MSFPKVLRDVIINDSKKAQSAFILCESFEKKFPPKALEEKRWALYHLQKCIEYLNNRDQKNAEHHIKMMEMSFKLSQLYSLYHLVLYLYSSDEYFNSDDAQLLKNKQSMEQVSILDSSYEEKFDFDDREEMYEYYSKNLSEIDSHITFIYTLIGDILNFNNINLEGFLKDYVKKTYLTSDDLEKIFLRLGQIFDEYMPTVMFAISWVEKSYNGALFNFATTELRSFIHHLREALLSEDLKTALEEIENGAEHLRRSAVESVQKYMDIVISILNQPPIILCEKGVQIKKEYPILYAKFRFLKSRKNWKEAIDIMYEYAGKLEKTLKEDCGVPINIIGSFEKVLDNLNSAAQQHVYE